MRENIATMIIRKGNVLEFVDADGNSLGKFHRLQSEAILDGVKDARKDNEPYLQLIQNYYEQLSSPEQTPAGNPAGFERKEQ